MLKSGLRKELLRTGYCKGSRFWVFSVFRLRVGFGRWGLRALVQSRIVLLRAKGTVIAFVRHKPKRSNAQLILSPSSTFFCFYSRPVPAAKTLVSET